jgi:hypothetical protein
MDKKIEKIELKELLNQLGYERRMVEDIQSTGAEIIFLPVRHDNRCVLNLDNLKLVKLLQASDVRVEIAKGDNEDVDVVELRSADINIFAGLVNESAIRVLETVLAYYLCKLIDETVLKRENDKTSGAIAPPKQKKSRANPVVCFRYYNIEKGEMVTYHGPASEFKSLISLKKNEFRK